MKKSIITHIVVMIAAAVIGWYIASMLTVKRADIVGIEDKISKAPLGGFNKFASDIQWMLFINYCGGIESVNSENVEEIYKRLDGILRNDPNHEAAYELGGLLFSVKDPKKAVEIFTRGTQNPNLKSNWKIPFYAGFVLSQHMKDADDPLRLKKAELMFREALARNSSAEHVFSTLINTRAKRLLKRKNWKGIPVVNQKHAYLCALYDEWRKGGSAGSEVFTGDVATSSDLKPMLLTAAQKAKASDPKNKHILATVDKVMNKVLKEDHLCTKCLSKYAAGDRFCSGCGAKVEVYGVCLMPRCAAVMKGNFCSKCGLTEQAAKKSIDEYKKRREAWLAKSRARAKARKAARIKKAAAKKGTEAPVVKTTK